MTSTLTIDQAISKTLKRWRSSPFQYGTIDECFLGVCDYAESLTGCPVGHEWFGKYHDKESADLCLEQEGGMVSGLSKVFDKHEKIKLTEYIQRGDIVVCDVVGEIVCGIFVGQNFCVFKTPTGTYRTQDLQGLMTCSQTSALQSHIG